MEPLAVAPRRPAARALQGLDGDQRAAVLAEGPVVVVLAAAGSGKTRVLTRRIAHRVEVGSASPAHVLAVTFTRRAAGELRRRLAAGRSGPGPAPTVHTLHALGASLLQRWWVDRGERPWAVTRDRTGLLRGALVDAGVDHLDVATVAAELSWAAARGLDADAYEAGAGRGVDDAAVAAAWRAYEVAKRAGRVLDVDDLVAVPARLLDAEPTFASARTWWHRHLFVDEAQDLTPVQLRLLTLLAGDEPDLFLVGDPDQAIYAWNGSDPRLLVDLAAGLPPAAVVRLGTNHRSTAPVVAAAASVLAVPTAPTGGAGDHARWPLPSVVAHDDEHAEAVATGRLLREARWRGQRPWASMAVLARTRPQLDLVADALLREGVPHRLPGSLLDRPEVRAVLRGLRSLDDGRRLPVRRLAADLAEVRRQVEQEAGLDDPTAEAVTGEAVDPVAERRRAELDALEELVAEYVQAVPRGDLDGLRAWATGVLGAPGGDDGAGRGVTLTTVHGAKGLEWAVVVVVGCEVGLLPHRRSASPDARAEERRLAYVAASRAVDELHLSWCRSRAAPAGRRPGSRSPYLDGVEAAVAPFAIETGPGARSVALEGIRQARSSLRRGGAPSPGGA